jgi:hypothetical protein
MIETQSDNNGLVETNAPMVWRKLCLGIEKGVNFTDFLGECFLNSIVLYDSRNGTLKQQTFISREDSTKQKN